MSTGYILSVGDETTCGGRIIEGNPHRRANQRPVARQGDRVTCGKDGNANFIIGGISYIHDENNTRLVAGNLDSISGCSCRSTFIVTDPHAMKYHSRGDSAVTSPGIYLAGQEAAAQGSNSETVLHHWSVISGAHGPEHDTPTRAIYSE